MDAAIETSSRKPTRCARPRNSPSPDGFGSPAARAPASFPRSSRATAALPMVCYSCVTTARASVRGSRRVRWITADDGGRYVDFQGSQAAPLATRHARDGSGAVVARTTISCRVDAAVKIACTAHVRQRANAGQFSPQPTARPWTDPGCSGVSLSPMPAGGARSLGRTAEYAVLEEHPVRCCP
jgi:hypothetical protein